MELGGAFGKRLNLGCPQIPAKSLTFSGLDMEIQPPNQLRSYQKNSGTGWLVEPPKFTVVEREASKGNDPMRMLPP